MPTRGIGSCWPGIGAVVILCLGCNSGGDAKSAGAAGVERDVRVVHEECDTASGSAEHLDANGDGRADLTIVKDGAREVCRAVDLNLDGKVDVWVYMDSSGTLRRREYDFDRDGAIDQIVTYQGGVPTAGQRATLLANRLDTWDYYQNGLLARSERDSDSDARVDQWWEYPKAGCPLIHADANQDGKPDPGTTIDYCKETGYVPPERAAPAAPAGPDFTKPEDTPTEVDNKPMDGQPPNAEPPKAEPPKAEPPKAEPPKAEPPKAVGAEKEGGASQ